MAHHVKGLLFIIHEGDDKAEAMEKALAEHIAAHPEDAGRTVKDFRWVVYGMVQRATAAEISEAEIIAAEERKARDQITLAEGGGVLAPALKSLREK
jgi:hypothetical protein